MTASAIPSASAEVIIDADADRVYNMVTDLKILAALAEEAVAMEWVRGDSARPGAVFKGHNRNGRHSWSTTCTVTEAQAGRVFAFDVRYAILPIATWRYEIKSLDSGGCRVSESTWDQRPKWFKRFAKLATGVADRDAANSAHIRVTLDRLKHRAESAH
jgi:hypothetical protein